MSLRILARWPGPSVAFGVTVALAGCAVVPEPLPERIIAPAAFKEAARHGADTAPALPADGAWWKIYGDARLDALEARALTANASLGLAAARLSQARAAAQAAGASRLPQAGLNASAARQGGPLINAAGASGNLYNLGGALSWELDLAGRLSGTAQAADLDADGRALLLAAARLTVSAEVAQHYFALRAIDAERALVRATLDAQRASQALVERNHAAGLVSSLDIARARAEAASIEADALALDRRRADLEHALALLLGEPASAFTLESTPWQAAHPAIPPGIPSALLARRPDVAAADQAMHAAALRVGVARAAWLPAVSLTGSGGYASPELGDLLRVASRAWGVGLLLAMPLFDAGRREAAVASARADLELAHAAYREQVLVAFKEVEDQLSALRILADHDAALARAVDAASRAASIAESRYRHGLASQLDWLEAQRTRLRQERAALAVRAQRTQASVGLVRALGGGWGDAPPVGTAPAATPSLAAR